MKNINKTSQTRYSHYIIVTTLCFSMPVLDFLFGVRIPILSDNWPIIGILSFSVLNYIQKTNATELKLTQDQKYKIDSQLKKLCKSENWEELAEKTLEIAQSPQYSKEEKYFFELAFEKMQNLDGAADTLKKNINYCLCLSNIGDYNRKLFQHCTDKSALSRSHGAQRKVVQVLNPHDGFLSRSVSKRESEAYKALFQLFSLASLNTIHLLQSMASKSNWEDRVTILEDALKFGSVTISWILKEPHDLLERYHVAELMHALDMIKFELATTGDPKLRQQYSQDVVQSVMSLNGHESSDISEDDLLTFQNEMISKLETAIIDEGALQEDKYITLAMVNALVTSYQLVSLVEEIMSPNELDNTQIRHRQLQTTDKILEYCERIICNEERVEEKVEFAAQQVIVADILVGIANLKLRERDKNDELVVQACGLYKSSNHVRTVDFAPWQNAMTCVKLITAIFMLDREPPFFKQPDKDDYRAASAAAKFCDSERLEYSRNVRFAMDLETQPAEHLIATRMYVKTLIKIGKFREVTEVVDSCLSRIPSLIVSLSDSDMRTQIIEFQKGLGELGAEAAILNNNAELAILLSEKGKNQRWREVLMIEHSLSESQMLEAQNLRHEMEAIRQKLIHMREVVGTDSAELHKSRRQKSVELIELISGDNVILNNTNINMEDNDTIYLIDGTNNLFLIFCSQSTEQSFQVISLASYSSLICVQYNGESYSWKKISKLYSMYAGAAINGVSNNSDIERLDRIINKGLHDIYDELLELLPTNLSGSHSECEDVVFIVPSVKTNMTPIHAACRYAIKEKQFFDLFGSRFIAYLPTLQHLRPSKRKAVQDGKSLAVGVTVLSPDSNNSSDHARNPVSVLSPYFEVRDLHGSSADSETVLNQLSKADIACLYCHGMMGTKLPEKAALLLADGQLELWKLKAYSLQRSPAIFLASCETGAIAGGAELEGFPSFLLEAGAACVVAPIWPVKSDIAEDFFTRVFESIVPPDERLSLAQACCEASHSVRNLSVHSTSETSEQSIFMKGQEQSAHGITAISENEEISDSQEYMRSAQWAGFFFYGSPNG